jgi:hypothetical protein
MSTAVKASASKYVARVCGRSRCVPNQTPKFLNLTYSERRGLEYGRRNAIPTSRTSFYFDLSFQGRLPDEGHSRLEENEGKVCAAQCRFHREEHGIG